MTDYKYLCGWRSFRLRQRQKETAQAIVSMIVVVLLYGFVGYLEQEPVAKLQTMEARR